MAGHSKWANIQHRKGAQDRKREKVLRAGARAAGGEEGVSWEKVRYEGYGPGGAAVMVDCVTDNRDRTAADIRHAFSSCGGIVGAAGSVAYLFNRVGLMSYPPGTNEKRVMDVALQAGAEDVLTGADGSIEVLTDPLDYETVRARLAAAGLIPATGEITQRASTHARLQGQAAESMVQLLETLDDLDDVRNVYTNAEIPDEILARV